MIVLVDSSVWIEFFHRRPQLDSTQIEGLTEEHRVVTCQPITTEVLSGEMSTETRKTVSLAFSAMACVDPDWSSPETWRKIVELALDARKKGAGVPGIVDRMILLAARESGAVLWTDDKKLGKLASRIGVALY